MTKMQVFAKCITLALGLFALNTILRLSLVLSSCSQDKCLYGNSIIILISFCLLLSLVIYFIIKGKGFALYLAGQPKPDDVPIEISDFIKALRLTIIFSGLFFILWMLRNLVTLPELIIMMRALLFKIFGSETYSHQLPENFMNFLSSFKNLLHTCLIAYLIIGAPAYVRWQVRKIFLKYRLITKNPQENKYE